MVEGFDVDWEKNVQFLSRTIGAIFRHQCKTFVDLSAQERLWLFSAVDRQEGEPKPGHTKRQMNWSVVLFLTRKESSIQERGGG